MSRHRTVPRNDAGNHVYEQKLRAQENKGEKAHKNYYFQIRNSVFPVKCIALLYFFKMPSIIKSSYRLSGANAAYGFRYKSNILFNFKFVKTVRIITPFLFLGVAARARKNYLTQPANRSNTNYRSKPPPSVHSFTKEGVTLQIYNSPTLLSGAVFRLCSHYSKVISFQLPDSLTSKINLKRISNPSRVL